MIKDVNIKTKTNEITTKKWENILLFGGREKPLSKK